MKTKKCFKCNCIKPLNEFPKHYQMKDGYQNKCKKCTREDIIKVEVKCLVCKKKFKIGRASAKRGRGKYCSRQCWYVKFREMVKTGEKNPAWKGDDVGYAGVHDWVKKELGKPKYCEHCKKTDKKKYDWSNKDHKYRRVKKDWQRLCRKCHIAYDNKYLNSQIGKWYEKRNKLNG